MSTTEHHAIDADAVRQHAAEAARRAAGTDLAPLITTCASDEDAMLSEIDRLSAEVAQRSLQLADEKRRYSDLLAIARATVAADRENWPRPLGMLTDHLACTCQLPDASTTPYVLLAQR